MNYRKIFLFALISVVALNATAQDNDTYDEQITVQQKKGEFEYSAETQGSFSHGKTPLWLNANKYGLSSLDETNGYIRGTLQRDISNDKEKKLGYGFGVDAAVPFNYTSNVVLQQAYVEGRWLYGTLSIGAKERPMNLKNNNLSSGSQTFGINARPVPQVRLSLEDYWKVPLTGGWVQLKGHVAYGMMTDDSWQHKFTNKRNRYADNVLYHSKAGFIRIGSEPHKHPLSVELGLEMASQFGGKLYIPNADGTMTVINGNTSFRGFWNAFLPGGKDITDGDNYKNAEGNQLGSWVMRLNYEKDQWKAGFYVDKYFEDHSAMFQLDYNGYGSGEEWMEKKKSRYVLYDFKDWMIGFDFNLKNGTWVRNIVVEYLYTKYQSGPIYHDHTMPIPDHIGGADNYYNHGIYPGWQHWGQVMGNPLYRSPIYNQNGSIYVQNNRFVAFHFGIDGCTTDNIRYRVLASFQDGLGTYSNPYTDLRHNVSFLVEGEYKFTKALLRNWSVKGGYAMDFGGILGNNYGFQLTIAKRGSFGL